MEFWVKKYNSVPSNSTPEVTLNYTLHCSTREGWMIGRGMSENTSQTLHHVAEMHEYENGLKNFLKDNSWFWSNNCILLPKLFWPTVRKNCSTDREKLLKLEAENQEFAKFLRSLEQFVQAVKGQNNFW